MTAADRGFLLLCCDLGDPTQKPLTLSQLRLLRRRVRLAAAPEQPERDLTATDLLALGYDLAHARQIEALMDREAQLDQYLRLARQAGVTVLTCAGARYPRQLAQTLGDDAPAVLFCRGELSLLSLPCVALVGSRRLNAANRSFAEQIGSLAAREGYVLVSGNAEGADRAAQDACLKAGGGVISFVPDQLVGQPVARRQLLISEDSFYAEFSAQRALRRNRFIHAMGEKTLVAQCSYGHGGSWSGAMENLRRGWSEVYMFDDGSEAAAALAGCGATLLRKKIDSLLELKPEQTSLF